MDGEKITYFKSRSHAPGQQTIHRRPSGEIVPSPSMTRKTRAVGYTHSQEKRQTAGHSNIPNLYRKFK